MTIYHEQVALHNFQQIWKSLWPRSISREYSPDDPCCYSMMARIGPLLVEVVNYEDMERGRVWVSYRKTFNKWGDSCDWYMRRLPSSQKELIALIWCATNELINGHFDPRISTPTDLGSMTSRYAKKVNANTLLELDRLLKDTKAHEKGHKLALKATK